MSLDFAALDLFDLDLFYLSILVRFDLAAFELWSSNLSATISEHSIIASPWSLALDKVCFKRLDSIVLAVSLRKGRNGLIRLKGVWRESDGQVSEEL